MNKLHQTNTSVRQFARNRSSRATRQFAQSGVMTGGALGYSSAIALGDAIRRKIVHNAEYEAQHGPVKITFLDGAPVPSDQQLFGKFRIREIRALATTLTAAAVSKEQ